MKFDNLYRLTLCFFFLASQSWGLPQYETTLLPFPEKMDEGDKALAVEVLKLQVYQDAKDSNKYYYVPPFHVRPYKQGAGGMLLHANNIKQFTKANQEIAKRLSFFIEYNQAQLEKLYARVQADTEKVSQALEKLEEAIKNGNEQIIALREGVFKSNKDSLDRSTRNLIEAEEKVKTGASLVPAGINKGYNENIIMILASAGVKVSYTGKEDPDDVFANIQKAIDVFSSSYGGYLGINAYGGFTKAQLNALTTYKTKYMPHIKIALLPVEKLSFFPLTEWQEGSKTSALMFKQVKGAGDYLGSAIIMDTTIAGAVGLAEHLAPFVLPIGIKATLRQQIEATEAVLHCDFSNGFSVKGRADVKDGLVIYDNDVTNTIKAKDENNGACTLEHISGDVTSAQYAALMKMEKDFENMRLDRVLLSRKEKEAYFRGVLADIDNNRREEEPHYTRTVRQFTQFGWEEVVIEGLTRAADFHWYTNIQDTSNISAVKFSKKISIKGSEKVVKDLPTNLCLVYNSALRSYDRCLEVEEDNAKNMPDSMQEAKHSSVCQETIDPFQCGRERDEAGETISREYTPIANDTAVPGTLS